MNKQTNTTTKLTQDEAEVLKAMAIAALDSTGGDFGLMDEVAQGDRSAQAFGALVTNLQVKGLVEVHRPHRVNGEHRIQQYTLEDAGWVLAGFPEQVRE